MGKSGFALLLSLVLALVGCGGGTSPTPQTSTPSGPPSAPTSPSPAVAKVRIGLDSFGSAVLVYVAQQQGFFDDHAIDETISLYQSGLDTLNAALAGSGDFGYGADYGSLGAMSPNQLRYVATVDREPAGFYRLVLTDRVESPQDLPGKRMGVVPGTQFHFITLAYLDKLGIPRDEVDILEFGSVLEIVSGMRTGQVDAAWLFGPSLTEAQKIEGVTLTAEDTEILSAFTGYLIATRKMVEEKPDVVKRVLAALIDADVWIEANDADRRITAAYIADALNAPPDETLDYIEDLGTTVSFEPGDLKLLEEYAEFRMEMTPDKPLDVSKYLALDLLRELDPTRVTVP